MLLLKRGIRATAERLTICRRSVSQLPLSKSGLLGTVTVWSVLVLNPWKYPVQWAFGLYLQYAQSTTAIYGALSALVFLIVWLYYAGTIFCLLCGNRMCI